MRNVIQNYLQSIYYVPLVILLFFFTQLQLNASDLKPRNIALTKNNLSCNESSQIIIEVCNINIYDALASEWHVAVTVYDQNENVVFQEEVPGVFLANGSDTSPTCTEVTTEGNFVPETFGNYQIFVDVNYQFDINTGNDGMSEEITVTCAPGAIHGQKYLDINQNGVADPNEVGVNGVVIKLFKEASLVDSQKTHSMDLDGDNFIDPISETGLFWFDSLDVGTYTVSEIVPAGWHQIFPANNAVHTIELGPGEIVENVLFGNFAELWDFGDLPEPLDPTLPCAFGQCYPTKLPLGAAHVASGPLLGDFRDSELDGLPTFTADGDDTTGVDDEDGVEFIKFNPDETGEVNVKVSGNPNDFPAFLSAWIDFNADGMFAASELIINTMIPNPGVYNITFIVPTEVARGGASRFRVSSEPSAVDEPYGPAIDGEVEDYFAFGLDYGDANEDVMPINPEFPYGYPVKTTSNGARHVIVPTMRLGNELIDHEQNGVPSFYSNSDDNDNREDEYGIAYGDGFEIVFNGPDPDKPSRNLTIYGMAQGKDVTITPLATQGGLLNLWIDWNRDGDWRDEGEQIFDDQPIVSGPNYTPLTFTVPVDAENGYTYARYRYSTQIGLEYYGGAPNGEVEDHLVKIDQNITAVNDLNEEGIPTNFALKQNYPNPFNPSTIIEYSIPAVSNVKGDVNVQINLFDVLGRQVATLVNELKKPGNYTVKFNSNSVNKRIPSGVYYYQIKAGSFVETKKMMLIK
ncbi:MAG: T9SS type A sorting domain-containing protein [Ignavibacteriales bacterium]|nr:T9SS type A sorting domain-containing protein [Ignavibacteriales bacterium]MCB9218227.1 T9SS type A sorting domain-containing protein [Ignavibacteriales bacterium]MCB9260728.1 T9SS type A sorting domain-containing protein [Ignavibacteriales bacterium]